MQGPSDDVKTPLFSFSEKNLDQLDGEDFIYVERWLIHSLFQ